MNFLRRANELRRWRDTLYSVGADLDSLVSNGILFNRLTSPVRESYYERKVSPNAMVVLKRSRDRIANWRVHCEIGILQDGIFLRRYKVSEKEALDSMERYCTKKLGRDEFLLGSIVVTDYSYRDCEVTALREIQTDRIVVLGYRMHPTQIDVQHMRSSGKCLPAFRWRIVRHVNTAITFPFSQDAKDYRLLK